MPVTCSRNASKHNSAPHGNRRSVRVPTRCRSIPGPISVAVRWYLRYGLSYRDAGELLAGRGTAVDHVTGCRWVRRFTPELIEAARPGRHAPGARWFAGETYRTVAGKWSYLYRAAGQHGQVIDVLLSARRDLAAARHFFTPALRAGTIPVETTHSEHLRVARGHVRRVPVQHLAAGPEFFGVHSQRTAPAHPPHPPRPPN